MADLNTILGEVDTAINDPTNGILAKVNELASAANDDAKKAAIIALIGSLIGLVIKTIQAATAETT